MVAENSITMKHIRYFLAVYEKQSITSAASEMNVSQPAMGMQIRALEEVLSSVLFERTPAGLLPTLAAHTFADYATDMLDKLKGGCAAVRALTKQNLLPIRLGTTTTSGRELIGPLLRATKARARPRVVLSFHEVSSDQSLPLLRKRKIDVALSYEDDIDPSFEVVALYADEFALVGSRQVLGHLSSPLPLKAISDIPLLAASTDRGSRRFLQRVVSEFGGHLNINVEVDSTSFKKELLFNHGQCVIVPRGRFLHEAQSGQLVILPFQPRLTRTMNLILPRNSAPAAREFLKSTILACVKQVALHEELGWTPLAGTRNPRRREKA